MPGRVVLVVARKPRRSDGGRGRHPGLPLDAHPARAAPAPRRLQMGGHAREYAISATTDASRYSVSVPARCSLTSHLPIFKVLELELPNV